MRKLLMAGIVAALGVGVSMGVVFAGDSSNTIVRASAAHNVPARAVHEVSASQAKVAAKATHGFKYFETDPFPVQVGQTGGGTLKCPRHWKAINGYFGAAGNEIGAIEDFVGGAQFTPRKWTEVVRNNAPPDGSSTPPNAFVGVVCGRL